VVVARVAHNGAAGTANIALFDCACVSGERAASPRRQRAFIRLRASRTGARCHFLVFANARARGSDNAARSRRDMRASIWRRVISVAWRKIIGNGISQAERK